MVGFIILGVLLYLALSLGFRWGKKVGAGAERHEYAMQAGRNGGYIYIGGVSEDEWQTGGV